MTARPPFLDRVCNAVMNLGAVWFTLTAGWGMFSPIGGGHYGATAIEPVSAENMISWKIIGPVLDYTATRPEPASYYCHHPFMSFWGQVPLVGIFGHHDWLVYFPAVVMSGLTAFFIGRAARNAWGPLGGAAATLGFVSLPITLTFSNYSSLEVYTMFGWSLFFWGHSAMLKTWKKRYIAASALGCLIAVNSDWPGYLAAGVFLAWTLLQGFLLPQRIVPKVKARPLAQWWAVSAAIVFGTFVFWLILFYVYKKIGELFSQADARATGPSTLEELLKARAYRIEVMFTPAVIWLAKLAVPLAVARVLVKRRDAEVISLAALVAAGVQFVAFKQGAYIHIFWPHYFAFYFAFVFAQVVISLRWAVEKLWKLVRWAIKNGPPLSFLWVGWVVLVAAGVVWMWPLFEPRTPQMTTYLGKLAIVVGAMSLGLLVLSRIRAKVEATSGRPWPELGGYVAAFGAMVLFTLAILPDGLYGLREGRETWGRFNEDRIRSDTDAARVVEMLAPRIAPGTYLNAHGSLGWGWHLTWSLHGLHQDVHSLPSRDAFNAEERNPVGHVPRSSPFWIARASGLSGADLIKLASDFHLELYGDIAVVDLRRPPAPLDAYVWAEKEPNIFEWYFLGGNEPVTTLTYDAFETWEWRQMVGQAADAPEEEPVTLDQKRIAYNVAIDAGDTARAEALRQEIDLATTHELTVDYTQGVKLVGARLIGGTSRRDELWFEAAGPTDGDTQFGVHSRMLGPSSGWSFIPPDDGYRDLTLPVAKPSSRWKKGHLYTHEFVLYHRIGEEKYDGEFFSRDGKAAPTPVGRERGPVDLLIVD